MSSCNLHLDTLAMFLRVLTALLMRLLRTLLPGEHQRRFHEELASISREALASISGEELSCTHGVSLLYISQHRGSFQQEPSRNVRHDERSRILPSCPF